MRLLFRFACFTAGAVVLLICSGGLVTSTNSGLAVPDWPNSYGYNMFTFPWARWASGGVFHEHSHRLIASGTGLLTVCLALAIWRYDTRRWLRWVAAFAVAAVSLQGILGGLRVVWLKDEIGIFHALLAHAFLCLICFIAFALSHWWNTLGTAPQLDPEGRSRLRSVVVFAVLAIYGQLFLGATMRHAHADLSIRDFPLAYGQILPPLDAAALARINDERVNQLRIPPTTRAQIILQMLHRAGAFLAAAAIFLALFRSNRVAGLPGSIRRLFPVWSGLILAQIALGIYTIWSNKAADIATAHVAFGAASLSLGVILVAALSRWGAASPSPLVSRRTESNHLSLAA